VKKIICSKCGSLYDPASNPVLCEKQDFGRLDLIYDFESIKESLSRSSLRSRANREIWRYGELLPVEERNAAHLFEGRTPLIHASRLGQKLRLSNLYLKDETRNPTSSFKDRAMAVGTAKATEMGVKRTVTASSGNAASSLAAYSAALGLECYAFVPDNVSQGKLYQLHVFGSKISRVSESKESAIDPTVKLMLELVKKEGVYPCPSFGPFNPYQVEGPKTIIYELVEQLGWQVPDYIFVPAGSGCLAAGIWKGINDFLEIGIISSLPRLVLVQPEGNPTLVNAVNSGTPFEDIRRTQIPHSIASGLLDPYPWDGDAAIKAVRATKGTAVTVSDEEIVEAIFDVASTEGIFAEASGAVGLAAAKKMSEQGSIRASESTVVLVTGSGLKEVNRLSEFFQNKKE
jgi:threonine synthase